MLLLFYLFIFQNTSNRGFLRAYYIVYIVRIDLNLCQVFFLISIPSKYNSGRKAPINLQIFYLTKITFLVSI